MTSSTKGTNPKDLVGAKKVSLGAVPPIAIAYESCAMMDGEWKYQYRNWRDNPVRARIYVDACKRHLDAWLEGQEAAPDSGVHHLGHARACLGIVLDAQATGNLVDDRSHNNEAYSKVMEGLNAWVVERSKFHEEKAAKETNEKSPEPSETFVPPSHKHEYECYRCGTLECCQHCYDDRG